MIFEWLFTFLVLYLLYKLIFDFIIPVSKATGQIKSKIREAQQQQSRFDEKQPETQSRFQKNDPPKDAEYIDYEEVK